MPRIFISYSRKDGATFAAELRQDLEKNFSVWQDITALEGSGDWWSQIEKALRSEELRHVVWVLTPEALVSDVVERELRLARREGKLISAVRGPGFAELSMLPKWLGHVYDLDIPEQSKVFRTVLGTQGETTRVPMMAPKPPSGFIKRHLEFTALKQQLLDGRNDAVAITAAFKGAGGYGKTTLALALADDTDINRAYFDGILWLVLGKDLDDTLPHISDLIELLTGKPSNLQTQEAAAAALGDALGDRCILLIIDDVWREQDLKPFLHGGRNTTRLITTRLDRVVPGSAFHQKVDAMKQAEAIGLLESDLPSDEQRALRHELKKLASRLGEWPLLLKLVNSFLRRYVGAGEPMAHAIARANRQLDEKGLVAFNARNETERNKAVDSTIGISLELLSEEEKQPARFAELGVFPEDADVPIAIVAELWRETGALSGDDTEDLLSELHNLSLLLDFDLNQHTFRLHDTVRHVLRAQAGKDELAKQHKRLCQALTRADRERGVEPGKQRYLCLYLPHHLAEAGEREALDALLLDPKWMEAKLEATGPLQLLADYNIFAPQPDTAQGLIRRALVLSIEILSRDPRQLFPQLLGRLMAEEETSAKQRDPLFRLPGKWAALIWDRVMSLWLLPNGTPDRSCAASGATKGAVSQKSHEQPDLRRFMAAARCRLRPPALITTRPSLMPPGAETAHLIPHSGSVSALTTLPDDQLVCGSEDGSIRQWDWVNGAVSALFSSQTARIWALASLRRHGRLAAGFNDGIIRLIDVDGGEENVVLEGHDQRIRGLAELHDGRLASGGFDGTIRLWNIVDRSQTLLAKDEGGITALAAMRDRPHPLASGSQDGAIRLWDTSFSFPESPVLTKNYSGWVWALTWLPDGRLAAASQDGVSIWNVSSSAEDWLCGPGESVRALTVLSDGRLVSGSAEGIVKIWDVAGGAKPARLERRSQRINAMVALDRDRVASGSREGAVRIWDTSLAEPVEDGPLEYSVTALAALPGDKLASGAEDGVVGIWDMATGAQVIELQGSQARVTAFAVLSGGNLASGFGDGTVQLWNPVDGFISVPLESNRIKALTALSDGRLAWGLEDGTIGLWRSEDSTIASNRVYEGEISAITELRDRRLAVGFRDGTLMLWDAEIREQKCLRGHDDIMISALAMMTGDRLAFTSGKIIKLRDIANGGLELSLEGHTGSVSALCLLHCGYLASGANDCSIRIWDVTRNAEIARLDVDFPVSALAALPGCNKLVAGDSGGRLHWLDLAGFEPHSHDTALHADMVASKMTTLPTSGPSNVGM